MEIKKDKVIMDSSEYKELIYKIENLRDLNNEYIEEKYKLDNILDNYKREFKILNRKIRDEKIKFYRNRKLFEQFIDIVVTSFDESILIETTNLTYKILKEEIMKKYDEDIKYN